jgi:hypothetical protein
MKTILILIILCCSSESENGYTYEAKDLTTNQEGIFHSQTKHNIGDTIVMSIRK